MSTGSADSKAEKVNPYDAITTKHLLDDHVAHVAEDLKIVEDITHSNQKIIAGFLACALAAVSHFAPIPFPQNWYLLLFCVACYLALTFLLSRWDIKRGDVFFQSRPSEARLLQVNSTIHVDQSTGKCDYELTVKNVQATPQLVASERKSVTEFIDREGQFYSGLFSQFVERLIKQVDKKKQD